MATNSTVFKQLLRHPLFRGIVANSITWPTACLLNESISGKSRENYDWKRVGRFFIYGTCVTAPMFYGWIRISSALWPKTNIQSAIKKVCLEQISYGPLFSICFFYGMTYMETQDRVKCRQEVIDKFWPTYKIAICYWPFVQTINFGLLPERNRVIFVSVASLLFTTFLAYVKQQDTVHSNSEDLNNRSSLKMNVNTATVETVSGTKSKEDKALL